MHSRAAVLLVLVASNAAWARHRKNTLEDDIKDGFAIELLGVRVGVFAPYVADTLFSASGTVDGQPRAFTGDGRSNGFVRPTLNEVALDAANFRFRHWFVVGGFVQLGQGNIDTVSALTSIGGGLHNGLAWSPGYFDLRLDLDVGVRVLSFETYALDVETCHARNGATYACQPAAAATQLFVQPRLRGGVHIGRWFTVGGYAGLDLASGVGWTVGGFAALHAPSWAPGVPEYDDRRPGRW